MGQCLSRNRQLPPMMGAQKLQHKQPDGTERTTAQEDEEGVVVATAAEAEAAEAEMSTSHLDWLTSPTGAAATTTTSDDRLFDDKPSSKSNNRDNDDTSPFADLGAHHQAATTTTTTSATKTTTTASTRGSSSKVKQQGSRRHRRHRRATRTPSSRSPSPPHNNNNNNNNNNNFTPLFNPSKLQLQSSVIVEEKDPEAPSDEEDFHIDHVAKKMDPGGRLFTNAADLQQLLKLQRPRPRAASINTTTTTTTTTTGTATKTTSGGTAVSLEPTGRKAIHPAAYSHFQKIKLQVAVSEHEQTQIANATTTVEERFQDVSEQRQLWKEYQEIQQAVVARSLQQDAAPPQPMSPNNRIEQDDDKHDADADAADAADADKDTQTQQQRKRKNRGLRHFWRRRREKRRAAQQQQQQEEEDQMEMNMNTSQNSSFLFDFSDMPPQDDMVVDIDPLGDYFSDDDGEESSQASLSLLSETNMEQQRRLFAEKARLRSIPMPQIDVISTTTRTEEEEGAQNNNNSNNNGSSSLGVGQSGKETAAPAVDETTTPPVDYGPTHMPSSRRQSDYGPERATRNNNHDQKQSNSADLCSLTSGGFETMSGVEVLVNHHRRSNNGGGTEAAAADEASLVSDLGDDYSVARSLASFRRYKRANDYGGGAVARNHRSDSAHDQIDPRFAEKLCETKLSDRLDKLEQALQKQRKENVENEEETGILTSKQTPVKSNLKRKTKFENDYTSDEALETPALAAESDHVVVTPETAQAEQTVTMAQVVSDAAVKQREALESLQVDQEKSIVTPEQEEVPRSVSPTLLESSRGASISKSSYPDILKERSKVVKPDPSGIKKIDDEQAPKLKGSPRFQTQVVGNPSWALKSRTGNSRQPKPVFRSSVQNVDRVLSHLLHTNSDSSDLKEESSSKEVSATAILPPQSLAPSSQSFRVVGLAPPVHPPKKKAENKVPVIGMSTNEFLKYGEELGFPEDEMPAHHIPQSLASNKEKGTGGLDRTEHERSEPIEGGNLPPVPCESFDEDSQVSEDVLKGYSNENTTTRIPVAFKIPSQNTDPVPIPLNPEGTNRLSLAELRGTRSDFDTAQDSLLLAEKVEAQVNDVLTKFRSYDSE